MLSDVNTALSSIFPIPYIVVGGITPVSVQVLPTNSQRRYLCIQNKSTTGNIWVEFAFAADSTYGIKIGPGGNLEQTNAVTAYSVNIIGDIASNPDVVIIEG